MTARFPGDPIEPGQRIVDAHIASQACALEPQILLCPERGLFPQAADGAALALIPGADERSEEDDCGNDHDGKNNPTAQMAAFVIGQPVPAHNPTAMSAIVISASP